MSQEQQNVLRGRVLSPTGSPLPGVEVDVLGRAVTTTTDSGGSFRMLLPEGEFTVRFRRVGFRAQRLGATVRAGEAKDVIVVLEAGVLELPEVSVNARSLKPIEYGWTTRYDDFFRRRQVGFGTFLTREELQRRQAYRTPNLLAGLPGIRLRFNHPGPSGTEVEFAGCNRVSVWIDGWKQREPLEERTQGVTGRRRRDPGPSLTGRMLQNVLPSQIELMEIFRGPAEMPAEFLDDSCAAVAIWTK